jgi:hypothetical protein
VSHFLTHAKGQLSVALSAAAVVAIGQAVRVGEGIYDRLALNWLAIGLVLTWGAIFTLGKGGRHSWVWIFCMGCCALEIWQFWGDQPLGNIGFPPSYGEVAPPILIVATIGALLSQKLSRTVFVPVLLIGHFCAGAWLLAHTRAPFIDVCEATRTGCEAFSRGENPYAVTFADIYQKYPEWEKTFYAPGWVVNGRTQFGYPYMPLSFIVAYAGHLFGDFRYGNLLAITAAGGLLAYSRRIFPSPGNPAEKGPHPNPLPDYREKGNWGVVAAVLLLLTPRVFVMAYNGWSEPTIVLCMALVVFCALGKRRALPVAIGLLMVSKQHMILAAPAVLLLLPKPWQWKTAVPFLLKAMAVSAVVTLPLVMWNFHAFWRSAVQVQLENPFRFDSLNFAAFWVKLGHTPPPQWIAFVVAIGVIIVVMRKAPRTTAGFAMAVAMIFLSFFAVEKQAFGNYYFFVIGALCCAIAASEWTEQTA